MKLNSIVIVKPALGAHGPGWTHLASALGSNPNAPIAQSGLA